ncbi:ABC transporter ATP-binding protein [Corynebacterium poyangense]|uniref:ABC transporter ATP-binding protein n=1 Tax=Corynebacterium poyangense TaxID=2684405 RepID=UPI002962551B|nr:ABC transporter ATP-binding protein [Corynebacterium poyangense]
MTIQPPTHQPIRLSSFVPQDPPHDTEVLAHKQWGSPLNTCLLLLISFRWAALGILLGGILTSVFSAMGSKWIGSIIDQFFGTDQPSMIWLPILGVLLAAVMSYYLEVLAISLSSLSEARLVHTLRFFLLHRLHTQKTIDRSPGEILSTLDKDSSTIAKLKQSITFPITMLGYMLGITLVLIPIHLGLAIATPVAVALVVVVSAATSRPVAQTMRTFREVEAKSVSLATDLAQGARVVKGLGAVDNAMKRFSAAAADTQKYQLRQIRVQSIISILRQIVGVIGAIFLVVWASYLGMNQEISTGDLLTVYMIVPPGILVTGMSLSNTINSLALAVASAERIIALDQGLNTQDTTITTGGQAPPPGISVWRAKDSDAQRRAHEAADRLTQLPNMTVIRAPHAVHVFEGTLADNVDPTGTLGEERLREALTVASCEDIVTRLGHDPYSGQLGEAGFNLSGGQRQRVALARLVAANPDLLILDDPTTGLDAITLDNVCQAIKEYRGHLSTVVISNSRAWSAIADEIKEF